MDETASDAVISERGAEIPRAVRLITGTAASALAGANLLVVLSISKFTAIFLDMLGGQPLPSLTRLVLGVRWFLLMVAVGLVVAAFSAFFTRTKPAFVWATSTAIFISLISIPMVAVAMFLPLQGIITRMQPQ